MAETLEQEVVRLRRLTELQGELIQGFRNFSSAMPFSIGDMIEGYDDKLEEIESLETPNDDG